MAKAWWPQKIPPGNLGLVHTHLRLGLEHAQVVSALAVDGDAGARLEGKEARGGCRRGRRRRQLGRWKEGEAAGRWLGRGDFNKTF